jgi:transposase
VAVCLEQKKGPLIYALLKYDFLVLFPVNPQTLAKYRRTFTTSRAKDDPTDAALMVDLLLKHRDRLSPWLPEAGNIRKLQIMIEHRRRLVGDKVRMSNRITSLLKSYYPQVLDWFKDKDTEVFCDFIMKWPTLAKVKRANRKTIERFFTTHNVRYKNVIENRLAAISKAMPLTDDEAIIEPSALMAVVAAGQLKELLRAIKQFDKEIEALFVQSDDYGLFQSLPGAGSVYAPRLLVAFGSDRNKYSSSDDISKYSGIAPVIERSGQKSWVHWRYSCPKFLRQSFVEWSNESIRHSFWAREFYRKQRDKGKSHNASVRALAFKWIRILYRCWQDRKPYDEAKYLMALQKKGSPLLANLEQVN